VDWPAPGFTCGSSSCSVSLRSLPFRLLVQWIARTRIPKA
jgi:hypothetical protein